MCGIAGYIGESKKPLLTYQLITKLFEKSEVRGIDAAGYWGVEKGVDGNVLYHKEPIRSSEFVKKDVWKIVNKHNPNLLLIHSRGASKGVGEPSKNYNNHPFTNYDKSLGLIHNGRVDDVEYHTLKQKYDLKSYCDSEIILRIIESGELYQSEQLCDVLNSAENPHRLAGIRDVFSLINEGHMAVAMGERGENGERMLWLFRNKHRPLWIIDMRDSLGQVFFVSEPTIWNDSVQECSAVKNLFRTQKLIELPTEEIWYFTISTKKSFPESVQRYQICKGDFTPWEFDGIRHDLKDRKSNFKVITQLDEKDQVISSNHTKNDYRLQMPKIEEIEELEEFPLDEVDRKCDQIIDTLNNIKIYAEQLVKEQSIERREFNSLLQKLEDQRHDVESISSIISR
jgi:predicted glutamine amidotransferase